MSDTRVSPAATMPSQLDIKFDVIVLDCPDPAALADFYCRLLGWTTMDPEDAATDDTAPEWVTIADPAGSTRVAFQLAPDYEPPTWPTGPRPQMLHLDLLVNDLDAAHEHAIAAGATFTGLPDSPTATFRVYTDPAGHPFCLCRGD